MLIKVKTLTGKEIELDIDPEDKISRIKEKVEEQSGVPPQQQRLIFSGDRCRMIGQPRTSKSQLDQYSTSSLLCVVAII
ncbi:hypothetical protein EDD15DRAFT_2266642, partial [Pisolithus albus]